MDLNELVLGVKASGGQQLADVPDAKAKALVRLVFAEICKQVEAGGEPVRVPGLGVFRTKTVEREKDGVKSYVTRTMFKAFTPKAK